MVSADGLDTVLVSIPETNDGSVLDQWYDIGYTPTPDQPSEPHVGINYQLPTEESATVATQDAEGNPIRVENIGTQTPYSNDIFGLDTHDVLAPADSERTDERNISYSVAPRVTTSLEQNRIPNAGDVMSDVVTMPMRAIRGAIEGGAQALLNLGALGDKDQEWLKPAVDEFEQGMSEVGIEGFANAMTNPATSAGTLASMGTYGLAKGIAYNGGKLAYSALRNGKTLSEKAVGLKLATATLDNAMALGAEALVAENTDNPNDDLTGTDLAIAGSLPVLGDLTAGGLLKSGKNRFNKAQTSGNRAMEPKVTQATKAYNERYGTHITEDDYLALPLEGDPYSGVGSKLADPSDTGPNARGVYETPMDESEQGLESAWSREALTNIKQQVYKDLRDARFSVAPNGLRLFPSEHEDAVESLQYAFPDMEKGIAERTLTRLGIPPQERMPLFAAYAGNTPPSSDLGINFERQEALQAARDLNEPGYRSGFDQSQFQDIREDDINRVWLNEGGDPDEFAALREDLDRFVKEPNLPNYHTLEIDAEAMGIDLNLPTVAGVAPWTNGLDLLKMRQGIGQKLFGTTGRGGRTRVQVGAPEAEEDALEILYDAINQSILRDFGKTGAERRSADQLYNIYNVLGSIADNRARRQLGYTSFVPSLIGGASAGVPGMIAANVFGGGIPNGLANYRAGEALLGLSNFTPFNQALRAEIDPETEAAAAKAAEIMSAAIEADAWRKRGMDLVRQGVNSIYTDSTAYEQLMGE
jgi:hypothetical protein